MKKSLFLFVLVFSCIAVHAQFIAPYSDYNGQVYMFDENETKFLETLPLTSYKVGKNAMLYSTAVGRLKAYYQGTIYNLLDNTPDYFVTDNWIGYYNFGNLSVLYNSKFKVLDRLAQSEYWYSDSLVVWKSTLGQTQVFYAGQTIPIEQWELMNSDYGPRIGDNTFAYVDRSSNFKIFYHGELKIQESYIPTYYYADRDIVAYIDVIGNLKIFSSGQTYETNIPAPSNFWTGEGFVAYYDQQGRLNIWYNGEITELSQNRPKDLLVQDNLLAFTDQGNNFYVWYNGKLQMLERTQPLAMKAYRHILVYKDQYSRLQGFYYGQPVQVSKDIVSGDFFLFNETVRYSLLQGQTWMWCKGKTFNYY